MIYLNTFNLDIENWVETGEQCFKFWEMGLSLGGWCHGLECLLIGPVIVCK